jgi:hypothetical protein
MTRIARELLLIEVQHRFKLAEGSGRGIACDAGGLFVGQTPLLEKVEGENGALVWRARATPDLDRDLSRAYGLPVTLAGRAIGLAAVARALASGELARAQITALYLRLPDPPSSSATSHPDQTGIEDLHRALHACSLLKLEWDEAAHPRWPAGSPDGIGGEFAPQGAGGPSASLIDTQVGGMAIPMGIPLEEPLVEPLPTEIVPPPISGPIRRNPYPSRPECVKEWAEADARCRDLADRGLLGKPPYKGHGDAYDQCVRGQVTEACGGNPVV